MFGRVQYNSGGGGGGGGNVCRFYQQGRCKFGDSCKYEHPGAGNRSQDNQNRFQALGNQGNTFGQGNRNNQRPAGPGRGQQYNSQNQFSVTKDGIEADLRTERPKWPFSAYGPGKDAPKQLFGGYPLEQSPEEMRVLYYQAAASGNAQPAMKDEQDLIARTEQQIQGVLNDLEGAVRYVLDGQNEHPNRLEMCQASNGNVFGIGRRLNPDFATPSAAPGVAQQSQPGGFGQQSNPGAGGGFGQASNLGGGGGFGQASALGQKPSPFGQPSNAGPTPGGFGQASSLGQKPSPFGQPAAGGFGQASALGAKPSAFGQPTAQAGGFGAPSALGQSSAFGQPSSLAGASPFAKPTQQTQQQSSPFAQSAQQGGGFGQAGAFGQPSALGNNQQTGAFGQPSALGQPKNNAFGQSTAPGQQGSAFGQPSAPGQQSNAFGQPSAPGQQPSAFGQPSAPGQQASPFGQPTAPPQANNAFGQPSAPTQTNNVFGQATAPTAQNNAFGQSSAPGQQQSAFGQPSAPGQQQSAFGQPSAFGQQQQPFGQAAAKPSPFGQPTQPANNQTASPFAQAATTQSQQPQTNGAGVRPTDPVPQGEWITRRANGTLQSFKGAPVQYMEVKEAEAGRKPHYRSSAGKVERIWHEEGAPARNADAEAPEEAYNDALKVVYQAVAEQGVFPDGIMPEVPPKYDWIRWDL